jgi:GNAT superfamily N-acetyltransferase
VVGGAQLVLESRVDGRHRAEIRKVMVKHAVRGHGIGAMMLARLEHEARVGGRMLLYLDTSRGADGAAVFCRRLGYAFAGSHPNGRPDPDGRLMANAIFYKRLRPQEAAPLGGTRTAHAELSG